MIRVLGMMSGTSMDGVDEVHVDKDVVDGRKEPVRVYAKKDKKTATGGDAA